MNSNDEYYQPIIKYKLKRREALNRVALLMGGVVSTPTLIAIMQGCSNEAKSIPFSLNTNYQDLVAQIADIIIPETDTPGAKEVGVGPFIEMMIKDCYSDAQGQHFIKGLALVEEKSQSIGGSFVSLNIDQQTEILQAMEIEAKSEREEISKAAEIDAETGKEKQNETANEPVTPFFTLMKELTVFGYFTSEVGMTQELDYVPIPGRYDACIPLEEGQKAYALS